MLVTHVNSATSFGLLTGESDPELGSAHVVRVAATQWDTAGRVSGVAVYDVNAHNATAWHDANKRQLRFIDYRHFVELLQVAWPDWALTISDDPLDSRH